MFFEKRQSEGKQTFLPSTTVIFKTDGGGIAFLVFSYLPDLLIKSLVPTFNAKRL